ncbi:MAG: bifunctional phosphopantothenoylcysteine decarboxylase/phosphopantothenate--cysteine ligase CoaBC [Candidatus Schekmanbacteria bacterium]|nr:bifunctional phosphopantothenoylcysteine decarboxylase/phosphopantothenate--cysteine ligase CoaBC [Candidatus Schekmanbacteria bacterium]
MTAAPQAGAASARACSLAGRHVVLGVTGSIAAYKAAELLRMLTRNGAEAQPVMTQGATHFLGPLTLATLAGRETFVEMFARDDADIRHIALARWADIAVVAPATADFLGKYRSGIVDDVLLNLLLALPSQRVPVVVAPAMNDEMFAHPAVQENLETLARRGVFVVPPEHGELACKTIGPGRLADLARIVQHCERALCAASSAADFRGRRVVVTAGPTRQYLDPVRFLSNPSTGRMGAAVARAAWTRGADVSVVAGPMDRALLPADVATVFVESVQDMLEAVRAAMSADAMLVMTAAVGDFAPPRAPEKIKKTGQVRTLELLPTPDILTAVRAQHPRATLAGFAAETSDVCARAREKLVRKKLDVIVGNRVGVADSGFAGPTTDAVLIDRTGWEQDVGAVEKTALAHLILDRLRELAP